LIKAYTVSAIAHQYLEVDMIFYTKSNEDLEKIVDFVTSMYQLPKETEAQKSRKDAMANELAFVKDKIASAVSSGEYQINFSPIWTDTEDKLKDAGYKVSRNPRYNIPSNLPVLTVSWG
jgi:hypothetical protein